MYIPPYFREDDPLKMHELIRSFGFATLVTHGENGPFATHLPISLDSERGPYGTLRAHVARGNPQWRHFDGSAEALVIFQGPHAYISPSLYTVHPSVPTWNYAAVHAYGVPRITDDAGLYSIIVDLSLQYEAGREQPWDFHALPEEYVEKMMRAIVGFEIEITRLEGKNKFGQNRSETDYERVVAGLQADPFGRELADWMLAHTKDDAKK